MWERLRMMQKAPACLMTGHTGKRWREGKALGAGAGCSLDRGREKTSCPPSASLETAGSSSTNKGLRCPCGHRWWATTSLAERHAGPLAPPEPAVTPAMSTR